MEVKCSIVCCVLLFYLVDVCSSSPAERQKTKYKLYAERGNFSTPAWPPVRKRTFVIRSNEGDEADWRISVALDLSLMQPEEFLLITELDTDQPQEYTYTLRNGHLTELHKSYRNNEYFETYRVIDEPAAFHSSTGRVKVMYVNYNPLSAKVGGVFGKYEKYLTYSTCKVSLLENQSNNMITCDNEIAPYASQCSGDFICPEHFLPLSSAECHSQNWVVCYPDATGLQIVTDCMQAYENEGTWESCRVDPSYVNNLGMVSDGAPAIKEYSAGRGLRRMQSLCTPSCRAGCSVPNSTSGRNNIFKYLFCCRCVAIYKCKFVARSKPGVVFGG